MVKSITLDIGDDYQLSGNITSFENYMFILTQKFIDKHSMQEDAEMFVTNGRITICRSMINLEERKRCSSYFNGCLKDKIGNLLGSNVGCFLIDFDTEDDDIDNNNSLFFNKYLEIKEYIMNWANKNNRVVAVVMHFNQTDEENEEYLRYPHLHILYEKKSDNELQTYIKDNLDKDDKDKEGR